MITSERAQSIRNRIARFNAWLGERNSYRPAEVPAGIPRVTNHERTQLELFEFLNDPPYSYFVYIREADRTARTWCGSYLGRVRFGRPYRSNFRDVRVPVTVHAVNGRIYHGTFYKSAGDYARIREAKF